MAEHSESDKASRKRRREKMKHDIDQLSNSLDLVSKAINYNRALSKYDFAIFKSAAIAMSSFFPEIKDSSVCEIDDLLYPVEDKPISDETGKYSQKPSAYLLETKFKQFQDIYNYIVHVKLTNNTDLQGKNFQSMDNTYIQMIESWSNIFIMVHLNEYIRAFSRSRSNLCRAIKLLKVAVDKNARVIQYQISNDESYFTLFMWLSKLKAIPEAKNPQIMRITSWLTRQSKLIFEKLELVTSDRNLKEQMEVHEMLQKTDIFNASYIKLVRAIPISYLQVDHLYRYFSSATNDEERLQRKIDFLKGNIEGHDVPETSTIISRCLHVYNKLEDFFYVDECDYPDSVMKLVDKYHCNDIEPFITVNNSADTNEDSNNPNEDQHDFTLERFFFYNDYLKSLYVLSMVYEACLSCEDLLQTKGDLNVEVFRSERINTFVKKWLLDPSDSLPWWFHTTLRKCPFLFVTKCHEYAIEDLFGIPESEVIDDATWESLYFLSNMCLYHEFDEFDDEFVAW